MEKIKKLLRKLNIDYFIKNNEFYINSSSFSEELKYFGIELIPIKEEFLLKIGNEAIFNGRIEKEFNSFRVPKELKEPIFKDKVLNDVVKFLKEFNIYESSYNYKGFLIVKLIEGVTPHEEEDIYFFLERICDEFGLNFEFYEEELGRMFVKIQVEDKEFFYKSLEEFNKNQKEENKNE